MKRFVLAMICLFFCPTVVLGYPGYSILSKIKQQSPEIWDFEINDDYIPQRGGIKVCKAENMVIVGFYLSQENMNFYDQEFPNGERKPLGFEMVITDHSRVFNRNDIDDHDPSFGENVRYDENYSIDSNDVYVLAISDPTQLNMNEWHTVSFHFDEHVDVSLARFSVQVQLVGDLYVLKNDFNSYHDQYATDVKVALATWFTATNSVGDLVDVGGNNYFNVRNARPAFDSHREDSQENEIKTFFGWPEGEFGHDRYLWNRADNGEHSCGTNQGQVCDYKPYYCGFGSDPWESGSGDDGDNDDSEDNGDNNGDSDDYYSYDESTDNTPDPNSHDNGGSDLSISNCYLSIAGKNDWKHTISKTLSPGASFQIEAEGRVRNESDRYEAKDVDWDWRVDGGKKNFDRDDTKLDEDTVDIDPNGKVKKHMGRSTVKLSADGKTVNITGPKGSKSFPVVGQCKFYIFIDVENDDDDDLSSRDSSKHEYGVVEIIVKKYASPRSNEIASETMKFYNSDHGAYFFSINSEDQCGIPQRYPDWEYHGTSLIAFKSPQKGTVPLYTCWTGSTHEYGILDATYGWQWISSFELIANCSETPWKIFDVYPTDGQNRKPIYLMRNANTNSSILSNGESDAYYLRDNHNFLFTDNDPFFWVPVDLPNEDMSLDCRGADKALCIAIISIF